MKKGLTIVFWIDAGIAFAFGLYSWLFPFETFGTLLEIPKEHAAEFLSVLSSLSLFYVLIGLICIICARSTFQVHFWIGLVMLLRHLMEGLLKLKDIGEEWLIGNPYPELVIHSLLIFQIVMIISIGLKERLDATDLIIGSIK